MENDLDPRPDEVLDRIAARLKALGNPIRLRIVHALEPGELSVSEIQRRVGGSQANVSKHLNVLRAADLVAPRRCGASVLYRLRDRAVLDVCRSVCDSLLRHASDEVERIERGRAEILSGRG